MKRIVLTGGPGAGKTAVLELARLYVCEHVAILPEAASMLFRGGFPRLPAPAALQAAQRAIYHVQHEIEVAGETNPNTAALVCDRGTIDGAAYWSGEGTLWDAVGTTREAELAKYDAVIQLRTPERSAYNHHNPLRIETFAEAARIDGLITEQWRGHSRCFVVPSTQDFVHKAQRALALLLTELPPCCARMSATVRAVRSWNDHYEAAEGKAAT